MKEEFKSHMVHHALRWKILRLATPKKVAYFNRQLTRYIRKDCRTRRCNEINTYILLTRGYITDAKPETLSRLKSNQPNSHPCNEVGAQLGHHFFRISSIG